MRENIYGPVNRVKSARLKLDIGSACLCADGWTAIPACTFSAKPVSGVWYKRVDFVRAAGESFDLYFTSLQETRLPQLAECGLDTLKAWAESGLKDTMPVDVYASFVRTTLPAVAYLKASVLSSSRTRKGVHGWLTGNEDYNTTLLPATYPPEPPPTQNGVAYKYGEDGAFPQEHKVVLPIAYANTGTVSALYYDAGGKLIVEVLTSDVEFASVYREEHPIAYTPQDAVVRSFYNAVPCGTLRLYRKECEGADLRRSVAVSVTLNSEVVVDAVAAAAAGERVDIDGEGILSVFGESVTLRLRYTYVAGGEDTITVLSFSHDPSLFDEGRASYSASAIMSYIRDKVYTTYPSGPSGDGGYVMPKGLVFFKETTVPTSDILKTCEVQERVVSVRPEGKVSIATKFTFDISEVPTLANNAWVFSASISFSEAIRIFIKTNGGTEWSLPEGICFTYGQLLDAVADVSGAEGVSVGYQGFDPTGPATLTALRGLLTMPESALVGPVAVGHGMSYAPSADVYGDVREWIGGAPDSIPEAQYMPSGVLAGFYEMQNGYYTRAHYTSTDSANAFSYSCLSVGGHDYTAALPSAALAVPVVTVSSLLSEYDQSSTIYNYGINDYLRTLDAGVVSASRVVTRMAAPLSVEESEVYVGTSVDIVDQPEYSENISHSLRVKYTLATGGSRVPLGEVVAASGAVRYSGNTQIRTPPSVEDTWLGRAGGFTYDNLRTVNGAVVATQTGEVVVAGESVLSPRVLQSEEVPASTLPIIPGIVAEEATISSLSSKYCEVRIPIPGLHSYLYDNYATYKYVGATILDLTKPDTVFSVGTLPYSGNWINLSEDSVLSLRLSLPRGLGGIRRYRVSVWLGRYYGTGLVRVPSFDITIPFPPSVFGAIAIAHYRYRHRLPAFTVPVLVTMQKQTATPRELLVQPVIGMSVEAVASVLKGVDDDAPWYVQYGYSGVSGATGSVVWAYAKEFVEYRDKCKEWVAREEFKSIVPDGYSNITKAVSVAKSGAKSKAVQRAYADLLTFISDTFTAEQKEGGAVLPAKVFEEAAMYGAYRNSKVVFNEFASPELLYAAIGAEGKAFALLPLSGTIAKSDPGIVTVSK